jgi:DNA-directed RNA polymerase subunit RPC12/RpoP
MTFQRETLSPCPACKALSLSVIETRKTSVSTRRRKECKECGYKLTTHEVSEEYFQEAKINCMLISKVRKAMELVPVVEEVEETTLPAKPVEDLSVEEEYKCYKCAHMVNNSCTLGIPEFNTDEANDCIYYVVDDNNLLTALGIPVPTL